MSNDIYSENILEKIKSKIDFSRLKRDYSNIPLITNKNKTSEYLSKEELEYLYIELNLSFVELKTFLNINNSRLSRMLKRVQVSKPSKMRASAYKNTCLEKYGVDNVSQLNEVKNKKKELSIKKFGVDCPFQHKEIKEKSRKTCKEKYGYGYYNQSEESKERHKNTCLEKYGVENPSQAEEIKQKKEQTFLNRYSVKNYSQTLEWQSKTHETKKKNGTFSSSKPEKEIYQMLLSKFSQTIHHPKPTEKYPFECDFYIPELDLYIEYQGYKTHGKEPFDSTNQKHIDLIQKFQTKAQEINNKGQYKKQYFDFIKIWTIRDPLKRETARKNNLNWIEFFNMKQFMDWFNKQ